MCVHLGWDKTLDKRHRLLLLLSDGDASEVKVWAMV